MTYLPGLRDSLVKAAKLQQESTVLPSAPAPRRVSLGAVATGLAAIVGVAVAVLALTALKHGHPSATRPSSQLSPAQKQRAERAAAVHTLGLLVLPPGAAKSGLVRGTPVELWSPSDKLSTSNRVDVYRVWRVPGNPQQVLSFLQSHPPAGSELGERHRVRLEQREGRPRGGGHRHCHVRVPREAGIDHRARDRSAGCQVARRRIGGARRRRSWVDHAALANRADPRRCRPSPRHYGHLGEQAAHTRVGSQARAEAGHRADNRTGTDQRPSQLAEPTAPGAARRLPMPERLGATHPLRPLRRRHARGRRRLSPIM